LRISGFAFAGGAAFSWLRRKRLRLMARGQIYGVFRFRIAWICAKRKGNPCRFDAEIMKAQ